MILGFAGLIAMELGCKLVLEEEGIPVSAEAVLKWKGISKVIVNELGFELELSKMLLSSYGFFLRPCQKGSLLVSAAYAGHNPLTGLTDWSAPQVENPFVLESTVVSLDLDAVQYCSIQYLIARADDSLNVAAPELSGKSMLIEGRWRAAKSTEWNSFLWASKLANSRQFDLTQPHRKGQKQRIDIVRYMDKMFDGIDIQTESPARVMRGVIHNLVSDSDVSHSLSRAHW